MSQKRSAGGRTGATPETKKAKNELEDYDSLEGIELLYQEADGETETTAVHSQKSNSTGMMASVENEDVELRIFAGDDKKRTGISKEDWNTIWAEIDRLNMERFRKALQPLKIFSKGWNSSKDGYGYVKCQLDDVMDIKHIVNGVRFGKNKEGKVRAWDPNEEPKIKIWQIRVEGAMADWSDQEIWDMVKIRNDLEGKGKIIGTARKNRFGKKTLRVEPDGQLFEELEGLMNNNKQVGIGSLPSGVFMVEI